MWRMLQNISKRQCRWHCHLQLDVPFSQDRENECFDGDTITKKLCVQLFEAPQILFPQYILFPHAFCHKQVKVCDANVTGKKDLGKRLIDLDLQVKPIAKIRVVISATRFTWGELPMV